MWDDENYLELGGEIWVVSQFWKIRKGMWTSHPDELSSNSRLITSKEILRKTKLLKEQTIFIEWLLIVKFDIHWYLYAKLHDKK